MSESEIATPGSFYRLAAPRANLSFGAKRGISRRRETGRHSNATEILQSDFSEEPAAGRAAGRQGSGVVRAIGSRLLLGAAALVIYTAPSGAQQRILNTNLIVNGNA